MSAASGKGYPNRSTRYLLRPDNAGKKAWGMMAEIHMRWFCAVGLERQKMRNCLNLTQAAHLILYDRLAKTSVARSPNYYAHIGGKS